MSGEVNYVGIFLINVLPVVLSFMGGWLTYKVAKGKAKADSDSDFREALIRRLDQLNNRVDILEKENSQLKKDDVAKDRKISELEFKITEGFNHIEILEAFYEYLPKPAWLKDTEGYMLFINQAYERQWGISRLRYKGKKDDQVWPLSCARDFKANDDLVVDHMRGMSFIERIPDCPNDPNSPITEYDVWKAPVVINGSLIGVGGVATARHPPSGRRKEDKDEQ